LTGVHTSQAEPELASNCGHEGESYRSPRKWCASRLHTSSCNVWCC